MSQIVRSLSDQNGNGSTSFSTQQNRGVLIAGLTCACFSVLATLITLRWFILMKRTFRHKLVMFLIFSDMFKALWYFVFPVVVFSRGTISSSSKFCQASGFFLALGIEASDFAILMIAVHSIVYIFHPPTRSGEAGGLYPYRRYIYPCWLALPLLAAALAFINKPNGYTTAGTFCYLPRRPFWYRLALSWIPRYCIITLIFSMYLTVYIYVTVKFRGFSNLADSESHFSSRSQSRRSSMSEEAVAPDEAVKSPEVPRKHKISRPNFSRSASYNQPDSSGSRPVDPWDEVSFITSKPLNKNKGWQHGIHTSDFAVDTPQASISNGSASPHTKQESFSPHQSVPASRKVSGIPVGTLQGTHATEIPVTQPRPPSNQISQAIQMLSQPQQAPKPEDPLKLTRKAIRKQLRYLFIYPAVYVFMWIFPFASHCLLYNDYYVQNPVYWLTVVQTCMLSLQAGVDCVIFSWREKPWRRIPEGRRFSFQSIRTSFSYRHSPQRSVKSSIALGAEQELGYTQQNGSALPSARSSQVPSANWWEAEGRKRKDSVWMGTDTTEEKPSERRDTLAHIPEAVTPVAEDRKGGYLASLHNGRPPEVITEEPERIQRPRFSNVDY